MQINHLINGKTVASGSYFESVNPATQEVLAEVASGGEAEVTAAVVAAKEAFPKWAGMPAPQRSKLIRKLGDLIAAHVPEIAQTETNDCGQVIAQTGKQLIPRAADNFYYFAEMCTRVDGHLEGCALPGVWQHRSAEDERAVAHERRAPGRAGAGSRHSPGVLNVVHGTGSDAGEPLCRHPVRGVLRAQERGRVDGQPSHCALGCLRPQIETPYSQ